MSDSTAAQQSPHYTDDEDRRYISDRLIYFSDAVIAIAMTLLALELPVPHGETESEVWHSFTQLLRNEYLNFVISFVVIGVFWMAHHKFFRGVHVVDPALRRLNLVWLLLIVLVPFATKVDSEDGDFVFGPVLYAVVITLIASVTMVMAWHAVHGGLLRPGTPPHPMRELMLGAGAAAAGFIVSIPVSFFSHSWGRVCWILILFGRLAARRIVARKDR
jgi:TMEM175 potassium channel family protein